MRVVEPADAGAFLERAVPFLVEREAFNGLILGVPQRLHAHPERYVEDDPALFALVEDEQGELCAASVRTPPMRLILAVRASDPGPALDALAEHVLRVDTHVPGVTGPASAARSLCDRLSGQTGRGFSPGFRLIVYELREVRDFGSAPGRARPAVGADADLLTDWSVAFDRDIHEDRPLSRDDARLRVDTRVAAGDLLLWEDGGRPVSMASRARPTPNGVTVNLVYTPPEFRRRGYATSCVARLSQQELDRGRSFCTLFADAANPTSNGIYRQIGYQSLGEFAEFNFQE